MFPPPKLAVSREGEMSLVTNPVPSSKDHNATSPDSEPVKALNRENSTGSNTLRQIIKLVMSALMQLFLFKLHPRIPFGRPQNKGAKTLPFKRLVQMVN